MLKTLPIKRLEDIERIKQKYREKEMYLYFWCFAYINTKLKMSNSKSGFKQGLEL